LKEYDVTYMLHLNPAKNIPFVLLIVVVIVSTLHYITLHYITLHYVTLRYI